MKNIIIVVLVVVLIGGAIWVLSTRTSEGPTLPEEEIASFEECVVAGYTILESYPRQCQTPDGKTFVEEIQPEDETIDWLIYRNEGYGFEFKYPKEWEVDDHSYMPVSDINWLVAINPKILEGSKEWPFLELRNYYTDPLPGTIIDYDEVEFSVEKVLPIGHQVIKILRDGREIYARCALYNFQFYELSKKEIVSLCNQMLSTFRFLE